MDRYSSVHQLWQLNVAAVTSRMARLARQMPVGLRTHLVEPSTHLPSRGTDMRPHHGALGSHDFPLKQEDTSPVGTDVMGPWVRVRSNEVLHLSRHIVHMNPACSIISRTPYCLTSCYCVDKLHKRFHYEVDTNFCLDVSSRCSENVDLSTGERWPVAVMCRQCCPFPVAGGN